MDQDRQIFDIISETPKESGKREASNDQQITHKPHALERRIHENPAVSDQDISCFSNEDARFLDSLMDIIETSGENALEERNLRGINSEFSNIVEPCSRNQENKVQIIRASTSSNMDILQNGTDGKVADNEEFKGIKKLPIPDAPTLPGPLCIREYNYNSNLCTETTKMISPPKLQRVEKMERKRAMCLACNLKDMSEHFEIDEGKNLYKCCRCNYSTDNYENLVVHIFQYSFGPFYCDACQVNYTDRSLHGIQRQCNVCNKTFACKMLLEDHYLRHEDRHRIFCRICEKEISKHTLKREGKKVYKCCESRCLYENKNVNNFRYHLNTHPDLRIFKCNECGRRFNQENLLLRHSEIHTRKM